MRDNRGEPFEVRLSDRAGAGVDAPIVLLEAPRVDAALIAPGMLEERFRRVFNLDLDLSGFYEVCRKEETLGGVVERGIGRLMKSESVYEDVFKSICGTNIQWRQAVKSINAIALLESGIEGLRRPFPGPERILEGGAGFLKEKGRVGYRADALIDLCRRAIDEDLDESFSRVAEKSLQERLAFFTAFRGIGPVTARYLNALYGDFRELAVDSLVISFTAEARFGGRRPKPAEVQKLYEPFGRWRYLAYWMEFILAGGWTPD